MDVNHLVDPIFHLSTTRNKTRPQGTLWLSSSDYEKSHRREIEFYRGRSVTYVFIRVRPRDSDSLAC